MSRLPSASGIPPPSKRLSRQPSLDLRKRRQQPDQAPPPVPPLRASKSTRAPSRSRTSVSSYDEVESPTSMSRYSMSSFGSAQTAMTSPRSSVASPKQLQQRRPVSFRPPSHQNKPPSPLGGLCVGERVAVDSMNIVGTLRFLGTTQFKDGVWAGIQLDIDGTGKNDGSVNG